MTITKRQQARIRSGARRGETLAQIAAAVDLTRAGVRYWLCRMGLATARSLVIKAHHRVAMLKLADAGKTVAQIAKMMGLHESNVRRHLAKARAEQEGNDELRS